MYNDTIKVANKIITNDKIENANNSFKWIKNPDSIGERLFTFDGNKIYNLYKDYPHNLTHDEKILFDELNPYWVDYFKERQKEKTKKYMNEIINKKLENNSTPYLDKEFAKYVSLYEEKFCRKVYIPEPYGKKEDVIFAIKESLTKNEDLLINYYNFVEEQKGVFY